MPVFFNMLGRRFSIKNNKVYLENVWTYEEEIKKANLKKLFAALGDSLDYDVQGIAIPKSPFNLLRGDWKVAPLGFKGSWGGTESQFNIGCRSLDKRTRTRIFKKLATILDYEIVG